MIPELTAAYEALSVVTKLVKTAHQVSTQVEKNQVVIEMQDAILALQDRLHSVQAKIDELAEVKRKTEEKLVAYEQWDAEAAKYQLTDLRGGVLVMSLKPEHASTAPRHWLCPNCFEKRQKSYLLKERDDFTEYKCKRCDYTVFYG